MSERRFTWPGSPGPRAIPFKPLINERNGQGRVDQLLDGADTVLGEAVRLALGAGVGVLLSPTRDGGALSVTLYVGDDRYRGYAASPEEFTALLDRVANTGRATRQADSKDAAGSPLKAQKRP